MIKNSVMLRRPLVRNIKKSHSTEVFDPQHEYTTGVTNLVEENPSSSVIPWPLLMRPVYVVSIRRHRMDGFVQRMGPWMRHMKRFPCTDGRFISLAAWRQRGIIPRYSGLNRGQLGCYDSHVNIWKAIASGPHLQGTVLEDDVALDYHRAREITDKIQTALKELEETQTPWEFLAWGYGPWANDSHRDIGLTYWKQPTRCLGFFAYTIKRDLAARLVRQVRQYIQAVDVWFYDQVVRGTIRALVLYPGLCFVVPGPSETTKMLP